MKEEKELKTKTGWHLCTACNRTRFIEEGEANCLYCDPND